MLFGQLRARVHRVLVDRHLGHEVFDRVTDDDDVAAVEGVHRFDAGGLVEVARRAPAVGQLEPGQAEHAIDEHAAGRRRYGISRRS